MITVKGYEYDYVDETTEPYIYSNTSIIQTTPGITEKIFVSLFGGTAADIDGFSWTVDNTAVCKIQPMGQYCQVKATSSGYARIKVSHPKSEYPYYIGFYAFDDPTKVTYITTSNNVLTMSYGQNAETITVNLVNPKDNITDNDFKWEFVGISVDDAPIRLSHNGNKATIEPIKENGNCTIRITHPDAAYPLDVLCRVVTKVKNIYITTDNPIVNISGNKRETITASLVNSDSYQLSEFTYDIIDNDIAEIEGYVDNQVIVKGKNNGNTKLIISHPQSVYSKEVLLLVDKQTSNALDASCYVTTTQNYIRTKEGASPVEVQISLKGGVSGDERDFTWSVESEADDGSTDNVIKLETTNGNANYTSSARAASYTYQDGKAYITGLKAGTAVITISHPKILYPTEILVKVLGRNAVLDNPSYFVGAGFIKILNGETKEYQIDLAGNQDNSDRNDYAWSYTGPCSIISNENNAQITAPVQGTGTTTSELIITHPKVDNEKKVYILTADTEEELNKAKLLYSDKLNYNILVGGEEYILCNYNGFDSYNENGDFVAYDFSGFKWTIQNPDIITVEKNENYPFNCKIKGIKAGKTTLTGSIDGYSCSFTITVYPESADNLEKEIYLTTYQNVISLNQINQSKQVQIDAVNLSESEYGNITWTVEDSTICEVIPNGKKATIKALAEGETCIKVNHSKSQNELKIYVRIGSEYVIQPTDPVVYISAPDVLTLLRDDNTQKLQAVLVNTQNTTQNGFSFSIDNQDIAQIYAQSPTGIAYIKPISSGQAEITIKNEYAEVDKKVLVLVGNSKEELAGLTYLTTQNNVVSIGEGSQKTISVAVQNADTTVIDGFTWETSNRNVIDVQSIGSTAVLKGNSIGTAIITVRNTCCQYSLEIIAQCVDPIAASSSPYIQLSSSVMLLTVGSSYQKITAELVGGNDEDQKDFQWQSNDTSILTVYGQNGVANCRALKTGQTYITVSHPKATYSAQILVVCDETKESDCYISVPSSIINMKPTDTSKTITASLINGEATDKYNFSWQQDVFDVIDLQYSANVATITPKQAGTATITVSHPKASYSQQIIVNVQQYDTFGFPNTNLTVTQGDVKFLQMQIPSTSVTTHIEYEVENSNICSVSGTKTVAQLTAVGKGTTTIKAKLIASGTGIVQAESELLVYVKEKANSTIYLTSTSTITTLQKDKSITLSASLSGDGVAITDANEITWSTQDSDIIKITGLSTDGTIKGKSIYITALKSGEALITARHEKAESNLQFYVVVPGTGDKIITLNKSYMTLTKGTSGATLKADIDNGDGNIDYQNLIWTATKINGSDDPVRIMGSGQTVTIYPLTTGEVEITAQLPDSASIGKCQVIVEAGKSLQFDSTTKRIQPFHKKTITYQVSPPDAVLNWSVAQDDDYFIINDKGADANGKGELEIEGIKVGNGKVVCVTDGNAKATLNVTVTWDYEFHLSGSTIFSIEPTETKTINYTVNPPDCNILVESTLLDQDEPPFTYDLIDNGNGSGAIVIKPIKEYKNNDINIIVKAINPNDNNKEAGSGSIRCRFIYNNLTPKISFAKDVGNFSFYDPENYVLTIGDGESVKLTLGILEEKASGSIEKIVFNSASGLSNAYGITWNNNPSVNANGEKTFTIQSVLPDQIEKVYKINKAYVPCYGYGNNPILNWETDFNWWAQTDAHFGVFGGVKSVDNYFYLASNTYSSEITDVDFSGTEEEEKSNVISNHRFVITYMEDWDSPARSSIYRKVEDPSLIGRIYKEEDFKKIAWFYCPGTPYLSDDSYGYASKITYPSGGGYWFGGYSVSPHVMTENVDVSLVNSEDKSSQRKDLGTIEIWFDHEGKQEKSMITIKVYQEIRQCECTLN